MIECCIDGYLERFGMGDGTPRVEAEMRSTNLHQRDARNA
jgi:hypothetical protein